MDRQTVGEILHKVQQLLQAGEAVEAINLCRAVTRYDKNNSDAWHLWGMAEHARGNYDEAVRMLKKAIRLDPAFATYQNSIGVALRAIGRTTEAAWHYRQAIVCNPASFDPHNNLGNLSVACGNWEQAADSYEKALQIRPDSVAALNGYSLCLIGRKKIEEAERLLKRAIKLEPDSVTTLSNLRLIAKKTCNDKQVMKLSEKILEIEPYDTASIGDLLFGSNYQDDLTQKQIYQQHLQFGALISSRFSQVHRKHLDAKQDKRLKIGYLTPDFHSLHPVMTFMQGVLEHHNRKQVEVCCYSTAEKQDKETTRMKRLADRWITASDMGYQQLAETVVKHKIDILVDLAGHTYRNSLPVFVMKPAPVQVTWLGYTNTTGLRSIDYRLTDAVADPEGEADQLHTEKLWCLPDGFLCYTPPDYAPDVAPPPSLQRGYVTFGSFNNPSKLSPSTIRLWSELLRRLPMARLILKGFQFEYDAARERFKRLFAEQGIAQERYELRQPILDVKEHLEAYQEIDIALDPTPYNGTTTTCEALWMGVPVITLAGDRHAARVGASILTRVGRTELIARNTEEYIQIASMLADDTGKLLAMRGELRTDMSKSRLCDAPAFVMQLEDAYRQMWSVYCDSAR